MKKIWIFHHYATPPALSGLTRPYDFGKKLLKYGYQTTVFSSSFLHYSGEQLIRGKSLYLLDSSSEVPFVYIRTVDYDGNGISRVRNILSYCRNLIVVCKKLSTPEKLPAPDCIYASSPHLLTLLAGIYLAGKIRIPCICEVRDLWPENLFFAGRLKKSSLAGRLLIALEHFVYRKADALIFTKPGDMDYLRESGWLKGRDKKKILEEKCFYVNNGIDLLEFDRQAKRIALPDPDLTDEDTFRVIYTGSVRRINHLDAIVETARLLQQEEKIQILIYGGGSMLEEVTRKAAELKLSNIKFKGMVDKRYVPYILRHASLNLLHYSDKLYNWSRGNSSNKLFEYMAAGVPILATIDMNYSPIREYRCGVEVRDPSPKAIAEAILMVKNLSPQERGAIGRNAREGAKNFDFEILTKKLVTVLEYAGYAQRKQEKTDVEGKTVL